MRYSMLRDEQRRKEKNLEIVRDAHTCAERAVSTALSPLATILGGGASEKHVTLVLF